MAKYKDLETKNTINDEDTLLVNGNATVSMSKVKEYSKPDDATQETSGLMSAEEYEAWKEENEKDINTLI